MKNFGECKSATQLYTTQELKPQLRRCKNLHFLSLVLLFLCLFLFLPIFFLLVMYLRFLHFSLLSLCLLPSGQLDPVPATNDHTSSPLHSNQKLKCCSPTLKLNQTLNLELCYRACQSRPYASLINGFTASSNKHYASCQQSDLVQFVSCPLCWVTLRLSFVNPFWLYPNQYYWALRPVWRLLCASHTDVGVVSCV